MEQIETTKKRKATRRVPTESRAKILVVDDDTGVLETLRDVLLSKGYDVDIALNGKQALDILRSARNVNLIITDMVMPEMHGLELMRQVRYFRKHIPVVILTAYPTVENVIQAMEEGARHYILKPFKMEELLETVKQALKTKSVEKWF